MAWHLYTGANADLKSKRTYVDENGDYHSRRQYIKHVTGQTPERLARANKERINRALRTGQLVQSPNIPTSKRGVVTKVVDPITGEIVSRHEALERIRTTQNQWQEIGGGVPATGGFFGADDRYTSLALKYASTHGLTREEFSDLMSGNSRLTLTFKELSILLDQVRFGDLSAERKRMVFKSIRVIMADLDFDEQTDYHDAFYM